MPSPSPNRENTDSTKSAFTEDDGFVFADPPRPITDPIDDTDALNDFFQHVNNTGKIGILRQAPLSNPYRVSGSLYLPVYGGRILGSGVAQTHFVASGSFDVFVLPDGARGLELCHITVVAAAQAPGHVAFRLLTVNDNCVDCYFHHIVLDQVWAGFHAQANTSTDKHTKGLTLENIIIKKRGYSIALIGTVDCRLRHVSTEHIFNSVYTTNQELRDVWITGTGTGSNGGGCYMDHVSSRGATSGGAIQPRNGIVVDNVLQLWGRHVAADNLSERGIWIKDCTEIFIEQGRSAICLQYCAVIETDPVLLRKSQVTLDSFFAGGAGISPLLIKRMEEVVVANSTFEQYNPSGPSITFPVPNEMIRVDTCRNVTVSACTFDGFGRSGPEGIVIISSAHCTVANSQFKNMVGGSSIDVSISEYICISGNCFSGPNSDTVACVNIGTSAFCTVSSNLIQYHYAGVRLFSSNDVSITGNTMRGRSLAVSGNPLAVGVEISNVSRCNAITGNRITAFTSSVIQSGSGGQDNLLVGNNLAFNGQPPSLVNGVNGHVVANNKT